MRNGHYIRKNGSQEWWLNDKFHRIDGPAIIYGDYQEWWLNGKLHRLDGPAIIYGDYQEWWIEDKQYTKEEFDKKIIVMNK